MELEKERTGKNVKSPERKLRCWSVLQRAEEGEAQTGQLRISGGRRGWKGEVGSRGNLLGSCIFNHAHSFFESNMHWG